MCRKAAKIRPLNAAIEQMLPKCDCRILTVCKSCKIAIVHENGIEGLGGKGKATKMRLLNAAIVQKLAKHNRRMYRASKSSKNVIIHENRVPGQCGRDEKLLKRDCRMLQLSKS